MDIFLNYSLVQYELYAIFALLGYMLVDYGFVFHRIFIAWKEHGAHKDAQIPEPDLTVAPTPEVQEEAKIEKEEKAEVFLTTQEKADITEALRAARSCIDRGQYDDARLKIIEGLSLDKKQKELNCLLAHIYEKENDFKKAELIYKEMIICYPEDKELYMKLGLTLSLLGKYEIAFEIYRKCLSLDDNNLEAAEMLANLGYQLGYYEDALFYSQKFLKFFPKNFDILYVSALSLIQLKQRFEALEALKKLRQLEPYNKNISDLIAKMEMEMELQKNFSQ